MVPESKFMHTLSVSSKDKLCKNSVLAFAIRSVIRIYDTSCLKVLAHLLVDSLGLVDGLDYAATSHLKIEMSTCWVVVGKTV